MTLTLHTIPTIQIDINDTICSNQSSYFEGATYTVAGNYSHSFLSTEGCDSIRTLHLAILNVSHGDTLATACDQFVWHGSTYTASDTVTVAQYATNAVGCDSAVTLHLTVNHSTDTDIVTLRAASIMLATIPIICVYPFLQKYFVKGMLIGSLKG